MTGIVGGWPRDVALPVLFGGLVVLVAGTIAYLMMRPAGCLPGGSLVLLALVEVGLFATWVRLRSGPRSLSARPIVIAVTASLIAVVLALYAGLGAAGAACQVLLRERTTRAVAALGVPRQGREVVRPLGSKDPSHLVIWTPMIYVGVPELVTAAGDLPITFRLPGGAAIVGPAGPTITAGYRGAAYIWTASTPSRQTPADLAPTSGAIAYASWYVQFTRPGRYQVPVTIGSQQETAAVTVLPLPVGGRMTATMTPAAQVHPQLAIANEGATALALGGADPRVLAPGQTVTVTPGGAYSFSAPQNAPPGFSLQTTIYQAYGSVHYSGTVIRYHHYVVAYPGSAVTPPWWWLAISLLTIVLLGVAAALAGGSRGRRTGIEEEVV